MRPTARVLVTALMGLGSLLMVLATGACSSPSSSSPRTNTDWAYFGGDIGNGRYSTLDKINTRNVKRLGAGWTKSLEGNRTRAGLVVKDGVMYLTAGQSVLAVDAKDGRTIWSTETPVAPSGGYKGVALGDGKVFVGLSNAHVVALDQKSGEVAWNGIVGDVPTLKGQFISAAPVYVNGRVIVGLANGDYGIRGRVVALDGRTGKEAWRFEAVPAPGEPGHETWSSSNDVWKRGGGGVWMNPVADPDLGLVYFGVGNPVPQWGGEVREGDNLYTNSVVALDIKTGSLRWQHQLVHHDIWDHDLGTPLILFDAKVKGGTRKALAAMRTDGYMFTFDRGSGEPIIPIEERPVPQNARLKTAPTQPFPVGSDQIGPRCVSSDMIPSGFRPLCHFDPVDHDMPNVMYPILTMRAAPLSYDPKAGLFIGTGSIMSHWIRRFPDPDHFVVNEVPGQKSEGIIAALDAHTGKIAWQKRTPYKIASGSGATSTAGGLTFHGEPDGKFQAYDTRTGDLLWEFQTGNDAAGPVAVYEVDGEQYVALTTTDAIWAFKLGGTVPPAAAPPAPETVATFRGKSEPTSTISFGGRIRDFGLEKVREAFDEFAVQPQRAIVKTGIEVRFVNTGKEVHEAVALDGTWTTGPVKPGSSVVMKFDKPGTYMYRCKQHPWSYAELTVEQGAANSAAVEGAPGEAGTTAAGAARPANIWSGVFTKSEALKGKGVYAQSCAACHGGDLGGQEPAPALVGGGFLNKWSTATLGQLVTRIRTTMPQGQPGSLTDEQYRQVVAYMLEANGAPSGGAVMPTNAAAQGKISIGRKP